MGGKNSVTGATLAHLGQPELEVGGRSWSGVLSLVITRWDGGITISIITTSLHIHPRRKKKKE